MKRTTQLHVEGMTCGGCVAQVEKALRNVAGVVDVSVNLTSETATVYVEKQELKGTPLIEAVRAAGYDAHVIHAPIRYRTGIERAQEEKLREQRQAFVHALSTGVPIMAIHWLQGPLASSGTGGHVWPVAIQAILCTVLLLSAAGAPILVGGLRAILHKRPNMDLLVALGVSVAYVAGVAGLMTAAEQPPHFHAAAMILCFINLGRFLETRARCDASRALVEIASRLPADVQVVTNEGIQSKRLDQVTVSDRIRVASGAVVPVDGRVEEGSGSLDESMVTGEAMPVAVTQGDEVAAGTAVVEGLITITATRVGDDATYGRIVKAVESAQAGKTGMQRLADRIAGVFVPIVVVIAILTLLTNVLSGVPWVEALSRLVAVLVIACPCAMGLATPTAIVVATARSAMQGILIRDAAAWERTAAVTAILLDKTGTLTTGYPSLSEIYDDPVSDATTDAREVLQWMASAEQHAQHPIARAILAGARDRGVQLLTPDGFESIPGGGCAAEIDGRNVLIGSAQLLAKREISTERLAHRGQQLINDGQTVIYLAIDGECAGLASVTDAIRGDAEAAISGVQHLNVRPVLCTGDRAEVASAVASRLGIASVEAELSPEEKLASVERHQQRGETVAVVGDGMNDAPALAAADVGMTFSNATDLAVGAADLTILNQDLASIPAAIALARRTVRTIKQNLAWAFAYNIAAIPLAATGMVHPGIAAAAMMFSSISVVLNSLRLRKNGDSRVRQADSLRDR